MSAVRSSARGHEDKDRHQDRGEIIGLLKAAETRDRLRQKRLQYQRMRAQEIDLMISCQPTALKAIRLQLLLPVTVSPTEIPDPLDKLERKRVEELLDDELEVTLLRR